jgi:hypothetical protein
MVHETPFFAITVLRKLAQRLAPLAAEIAVGDRAHGAGDDDGRKQIEAGAAPDLGETRPRCPSPLIAPRLGFAAAAEPRRRLHFHSFRTPVPPRYSASRLRYAIAAFRWVTPKAEARPYG